jgi:hypothetical protein
MNDTEKRCKRCDQRGEKWVTHTLECLEEGQRILQESWTTIASQPATLLDVLLAAERAAKDGGSPFGFGGLFGAAQNNIARELVRHRGLPTGEAELETVSVLSVLAHDVTKGEGNG